jgi:hypothetical protein
VSFRVTQVVDIVRGVHALIPKSLPKPIQCWRQWRRLVRLANGRDYRVVYPEKTIEPETCHLKGDLP